MTPSWSGWYWQLGLASLSAIAGAIISDFGDCAKAQITPDGTLGAESSVVTPSVVINNLPSDQIDGGAIRGANLFHSFREFNIDEGRGAYFSNPVGILNILSRVTGVNPSNILGKLGVLGNANLFLINPNGIIFGPSSSLSVNGLFVGTTANAIGLASGDIFSASPGAPLPTALLNVNPSAFFFNQIAAARSTIINRSTASSTGLQVPQGQSLLLVGGNIRLEGGQLQALGGRVELGGLAASGSVGLSMNGSQGRLSFPDGVARADVYLANSRVNVAASNSGSIAITARNIDISGNSVLLGGIETNLGFHGATAGDITLNATEAINIANGDVFNMVRTGSVGNGGDINVTAGSVSLTDGAELRASTEGKGNAGSVTITARDTVSFDQVGSNGRSSGAVSRVEEKGVGNSGDINIMTGSLSVTNGAVLSASTFGQGNGGSVAITARDKVSFDRWADSNGMPSGAYSTTRRRAVGNGGNITITTGSLSMTNGARLSTRTLGQGNGGNITLNANTLEVVNGGQVLTTSLGSGKAGNITLNVSDRVTLAGTDRTYFDRLTQYGESKVGNQGPIGGLFANTSEDSTAQGGSLNITTGQLIVRDGAEVNVSSQGSGNAGELRVEAGDLLLDNQGKLRASTASGSGGNINLLVRDLVLMRRNSLISADAGGTGNGGNITLNAPFIVAVPGEDNDIVANAVRGRGGNINIKTQGIYGLEYREQLTEESDISASSEFGVDGVVEINRPDIDPSEVLVALPAELIDASELIASGCVAAPRQGESEFIVTGRGGLPPNPSDTLSSDTVWSDLRYRTQLAENLPSAESATQPTNTTTGQLVEAQGWVINNKGEVVLTEDSTHCYTP